MYSFKDLLEYSMQQIEHLHDYYENQRTYVIKNVEKKLPKYKYGLILDKYFQSLINPDSVRPLTQYEQKIIDEMVDHYDIVDDKEKDQARITYKLKETFSIDESYELDPFIARNKSINLIQQPEILSESVLMLLLVRYEDAISRLFGYLIEKYPEGFLSDKSITFSELMHMKSDIEEIKERFIEKEIDAFMREPISNWYDLFKRNQKAKFLFADNLFEEFKEVYYRRNLIVHNHGIVNDIYLSNNKCVNVKKGERLHVEEEYLEKAFSLTSLMLVDTFFALRKVADNKEELLSWLSSDYGYNCLVERNWAQARYVFMVVLQDENMENLDKHIAQINLWIATKNLEGVSAIQEEVNSLDVSALQLQFSVAKAALLDNHEEVSVLLEKCLETKEIHPYYIKTWPLLNEFRDSEEYKVFVEKHRDDLGFEEYEEPSNNEAMMFTTAEEDSEELLTN